MDDSNENVAVKRTLEELLDFFDNDSSTCPPIMKCEPKQNCRKCWKTWLMKENDEAINE